MNIKQLFSELNTAYSDKNLNRITAKLISLYKAKSFTRIRELANRISEHIPINEEKDVRCFSKLITLYHPDKGPFFRQEIDKHFKQNNFEALQAFSHIFALNDIENITVLPIDECIEYNPGFEWDVESADGFNIMDLDGEHNESYYEQEEVEIEKSFFNLIKMREFGKTDVELPTYYLEDYEEFELSESGLESLSGVEYCKHVKILDVSNNAISDISELWSLENLEELYLSGNQISYIDSLCNLSNLKHLDLSENQVDDVSPLFQLPNIEFVNLLGNNVPENQIKMLEKKGTMVVFE